MSEKTVSDITKISNEAGKDNQKRAEITKMPLKRVGQQDTYTFKDEDGNETTYTFFFPGLRPAQDIIDYAKMGNGAIAEADYNQGLMDKVIVDPKTNWDYWDDHEGYAAVMDAADQFLGKWMRK